MIPNIYSLLAESKLAEALELMKAKIESLRDATLTEVFYTLQQNYKAYLRVQITGETQSDERALTGFIQDAYCINDSANRRIRILKAPNDQYVKAIDNAETGIFDRIWTSDLWNDDEYRHICDVAELDKEQYPLIVSAVTLALYEMFDLKKLTFLFNAYNDEELEVNQRALVGIILILRRYDSRMHQYPQVTERFSMLADNVQFVRQFFSAHIALQYSKMTDSVTNKMRNDIMPAILASTRFRQNEMGIQELDDALTGNGENPEWIRNNKADLKAEKKIHQMAQLQMEGADIYMATFRQLKHFPFFQKMQNWFLPFSAENPDVQSVTKESLVSKLLKVTPFCSSDKYSFVFMFGQMGGIGSEVIKGQLAQQLPDDMKLDDLIADEENDRNAVIKGEKSDDVARKYVQDLYRFFTIYPYHQQFTNPFESKLSNFSPLHRQAFKSILQQREHILNLAEFFMRKALYEDALDMFLFLDPKEREEDAELWQKIGFCYQKSNDLTNAYKCLHIADQLTPDSHWTTLHLSQITFDDKQYREAIQYLDRLIESNPDDLKFVSKKAECFFALEEYDKSIPLLYKVTYLDEENLLGHQMLAWGLLMTKSFDKAEKEYLKCVEKGDATAELGLGHILLAKNDMREAYAQYKNAQQHYLSAATNEHEGKSRFSKDFWNYAPYLSRIGVNESSIRTMFEAVMVMD